MDMRFTHAIKHVGDMDERYVFFRHTLGVKLRFSNT
jgi:hypothetical protein